MKVGDIVTLRVYLNKDYFVLPVAKILEIKDKNIHIKWFNEEGTKLNGGIGIHDENELQVVESVDPNLLISIKPALIENEEDIDYVQKQCKRNNCSKCNCSRIDK